MEPGFEVRLQVLVHAQINSVADLMPVDECDLGLLVDLSTGSYT